MASFLSWLYQALFSIIKSKWTKLNYIPIDNDSLTNAHGPYDGESHFLYLNGKLGAEGDYVNETGRVFSPMYTQSAAGCTLDLLYYINGNTGVCEDCQGGSQPSSLGKI